MNEPSRILMIRPSALGDVCRTVPVLVSLRGRYPSARIDWLVQDTFAPAIENHPDLSRAISFPRDRVAIRRWWRHDARRALLELLRSLRRERYDLVLDLQGLGRSGFFAWITRASRRIGFARARELGWLGLTERVDVPRARHTVDRMLDLAAAAGATPVHDMTLHSSETDRHWVRSSLPPCAIGVLAPTSRWPAKRWPSDRYASLARVLLEEGLVEHIAIVGAASEHEQCPEIVDLADADERISNLIGRTSVGQLMALVEASVLVVANDSAVLHMAVGFDRPKIGLFGPTCIDLVGPYRRDADVIQRCRPADGNVHKSDRAGRAAMEAISLDEVAEAVRTRLAQAAAT